MNQSATAFLGKADEALSKARRIIGIEIYDEAGRHAYYAAYHAAQALIFERTGKVSRTHKGVNAQFAKLVVTESSLSRDHVRFLARAYRLKASADYETGIAENVSPSEASEAIREAEQVVAAVRAALASDSAG